MNEQRRQILQMLAEGTITAEEAERLIDAVEREQSEGSTGAAAAPGPKPKARPKYMRVLVEDNSFGDEPSRVNIRVPLQLLRAGVKLTSLIPPRAMDRINAEMDKNGVPVDLTRLKPEDIEDLIEQFDDVVVDVDDSSSTIKVFCE